MEGIPNQMNKKRLAVMIGIAVLALIGLLFSMRRSLPFFAFEETKSSTSPTAAAVAHGKPDFNTEFILIQTDKGKNIDKIKSDHKLLDDSANSNELAKLHLKRVKNTDPNSTSEEIADQINSETGAVIAHVDVINPPMLTPTDPYYSAQWHSKPAITNAEIAWDSANGSGVTVADIDTGVDCTHPDLTASCLAGRNFYNNSTDTTDVYGHGTTTTGVMNAIGNNALGVIGFAWQSKVLPLRVSDASGYATDSAIASAIIYAADQGVRVANVSYQVCGSAAIQNAGHYARSKGMLVTVSEGNYSNNSGFAATPDLICVSATYAETLTNDSLASFSSWGNDVDVAAPGQGIWTVIRGGGFSSASGTSYSAPATAGVLALVYSANPSQFTADSNGASLAESYLINGVDEKGISGWDIYYGWGRINACKSVALAKGVSTESCGSGNSGGTTDTQPPTAPTNLVAVAPTSTSVNLNWTASTDNIGVTGYRIFRDGTQIQVVTSVSYTDSTVLANTTYSYTVKAIDAANNVSAASNTATVTTPAAPFSITSGPTVSAKRATGGTVNIATNLSSTATVYYGLNRTSLTSTASDSATGTTHAVTLSGLPARATVYYKVVVTNPATNQTITTAVTSFKTLAK